MKNHLARFPLAFAVCVALVLCGCGRDPLRGPAGSAPSKQKSAAAAKSAETAKRPYYRYSVVPGGVHSPQEARERAAGDPVVNRHYEGIDMSRLRPRVNEDDRNVYVSYRVGNEVYWTKKPVRLRRNEVVLSDGNEEIRTRCGNRISLVPMGPVHPDAEPNADVFDTKVEKADAEWPDAVTYADATPLGGVLTSVPLMPNWNSNSVPPPANLGMPPGMLATQAPPPAPIGGGGTGGGGGGGGGTPIVPVNTDGATIFNNWGGSVGAGLILVNQTGQNGPPGGFIINNVANYNNGGVTVYNNNQGGNTSSNTNNNSNTSNQILTTALYQTQTIQNFTQLTTSNQQIVNNNSSNTTNNSSNTTNNNTTNVTNHSETNNSNYYSSNSSVTNFYNNITNITNIINNCCCDGDTPDTSVPEPATFALFGLSLGALWLYARLRRRRLARRR